jgi:hypothetical protein
MQQQVLILTAAQQRLQARLGEPLEGYLRRRYLKDGLTLAELATELDFDISALSRWLGQFGIEARRRGRPRMGI